MHRPVQDFNRGRSREGRRAHGRAVLSPQFSCKPKLRKSLSLEKGGEERKPLFTQRLVHAGLLVDVSSERAPVPFLLSWIRLCVCVCSFRHLLDTLSDHLGIEGPLSSATALTSVLSTKGTSLLTRVQMALALSHMGQQSPPLPRADFPTCSSASPTATQ